MAGRWRSCGKACRRSRIYDVAVIDPQQAYVLVDRWAQSERERGELERMVRGLEEAMREKFYLRPRRRS